MPWDPYDPDSTDVIDMQIPAHDWREALRMMLYAAAAAAGITLWVLYGAGSFAATAALAALVSLCVAGYVLGGPKPAGPTTSTPVDPGPVLPVADVRVDSTGAAARRRTWDADVARHDSILLSYLPYETDPQVVMRYPAITDLTQGPTADFFDALHGAGALRTEAFPDDEHIDAAYGQRVATLARTWAAAERHARRFGTTYLDAVDARRMAQAAKLLRHAEGATTEEERATYLGQAKALIDALVSEGAVVMPERARAVLGGGAARPIDPRPAD